MAQKVMMNEPANRFYEFGPFRLDTAEKCLLRDKEVVPLTPKLFDLLLVFVENSGRTLGKEELMKAVWPGTCVEEGTVSKNVSRLKKALGNGCDGQQYIETFSGRGYRFAASVKLVPGDNAGPIKETMPAIGKADMPGGLATSGSIFGRHLLHALASCAVYAGLYTVALLMEVAYQFDRYGRAAVKVALPVFGWIFITSVAGLAVDWRCTLRGKENGLVLSVLIFLVSAAALLAGVQSFLPPFPITEAYIQTYTAHAAYLKSISYFLALAIFFLLIPFNFVIAMQREMQAGRHHIVLTLLTDNKLSALPKGTIYLRLWVLSLLLVVAAVISVISSSHLLDNLKPAPYLNLFTQLFLIRAILYFLLGIACLAWYYRAMNEIKRECLSAGDDRVPA